MSNSATIERVEVRRTVRVFKPGDVLPDDTNYEIRRHETGLLKALARKYPRLVRELAQKPFDVGEETR